MGTRTLVMAGKFGPAFKSGLEIGPEVIQVHYSGSAADYRFVVPGHPAAGVAALYFDNGTRGATLSAVMDAGEALDSLFAVLTAG